MAMSRARGFPRAEQTQARKRATLHDSAARSERSSFDVAQRNEQQIGALPFFRCPAWHRILRDIGVRRLAPRSDVRRKADIDREQRGQMKFARGVLLLH